MEDTFLMKVTHRLKWCFEKHIETVYVYVNEAYKSLYVKTLSSKYIGTVLIISMVWCPSLIKN